MKQEANLKMKSLDEAKNKSNAFYSSLLFVFYVSWLVVSWLFPPTLFWAFIYFVGILVIAIPFSIITSSLLSDYLMDDWKIDSITPILLGFAAPLVVALIVALAFLFAPILLAWVSVEKFKKK